MLITSATTLAICHRKGEAKLVHSCQPVTSYQTIQPVDRHVVSSTRTSEWLPQIAHFSIFVLAHKNASEPAGVLPLWQNSGRTPAAVVLSVLPDVTPLLAIELTD
jgi:hypothetical protein